MAEIQFEEEQQFRQFQQPVEKKSFFVRLVLSTGLAKTDRQAEYVLLGVTVIFILLAFILPKFIGGGSHVTAPDSVIFAKTPPNGPH